MADEELMVSGEGCISDDSSFYGDEYEQERLQSLVDTISTKRAREATSKNMNSNILLSRKRVKMSKPSSEAQSPGLFNDREGCPDSWQLGESVEDFIRLLPPLRTSGVEWIWVSNPRRESHGDSKWPRLNEFSPRGYQLLEKSQQTRVAIQADNSHKPKSTISRLLNQESILLQQRICDLASETNVLSGKWMLFPAWEDVTRVWRMIVDAVINNSLGQTAKVAPNEGKSGDSLICVYTKDFRDKDDVFRVLQELDAMGLVSSGRGIYYKSDPYTHLNIYRETATEFGLQASLYSSEKMLTEAQFPQQKPVPQKKQGTLKGFFNQMDIE